ncbi:menaquinone-dependent protoporphyrinogen oxidase [Methanolinea mesophila]|uniref:flavodoxin domain-containing protein n=1 Tax=Methanolinea mesophila TaxID=547055 RepID=UPI001AE36836|nr:flavodoxin domain-containing protein [Methanolinea mesophila]MBP1929459.1 menaquinone-dependent protoporphyrinogen oxidase [Methanolinea mesophila]
MPGTILVAYVSPKGSTAGIAEAIGDELRLAGYRVDVTELKEVSSLESYQAVIIGGPFYMGKIVGDVKKFVGRFRDALGTLPVAAFAVGVAPVNATPADIEKAREIFHSTLDPVKPVAEALFAGKIDREKLSFVQKWMVEKVKAPIGDFRDWDAIAAWARELPGKFGM